MKRNTFTIIGILSIGILFSATTATAIVGIQGGGTYSTIQSAVNAAVDGNTLLISSNSFYESVVISNKNLTLEGGYNSNLTARTGWGSLINGSGTVRPLWIIDSTCHVDRIDMASGLGDLYGGGGALLHRSWVEFIDSDIHNNEAWIGGGLLVGEFSYAMLTGDSDIINNEAQSALGGFGGGVCVYGRLDIVHDDASVNGNVAIDGKGGGIWVESGYLRVFQGDVNYNDASNGFWNPVSYGGGIGAKDSFVEIGDGVDILANTADNGGGMSLSGSTGYLGNARAKDVGFYGNQAQYGAGLYASNSVINSRGSIFNNNNASLVGGGAFLIDSTMNSDTNKIFFNYNVSEGSGGGLFLEDSVANLQCAVFGEDVFSGNRCDLYGGAIMAYASTVTVYGAQFAGNSATSQILPEVGSGGAIAALGKANTYSTIILTNGPGSFGAYTNITMFSNSAATNQGKGGVIYAGNMSDVHAWGAKIYNNSAYDGGAIYGDATSSVGVLYCNLTNNSALSSGGAMFTDTSVGGAVNSRFANNSARYGGAYFLTNSMGEIVNNKFIENKASFNGGAISATDSPFLLVSCTTTQGYSPETGWVSVFQGNTSDWGAVIYAVKSEVFVGRSAIIENESSTGHSSGLHLEQCSQVSIFDSLFADNLSYDVIDISQCQTAVISRCTIVNNDDRGVLLYGSTLSMSNTILRGAYSLSLMSSTANVFYSNIEGGHPGTGNFDTNSVFFPNYHLQPGSPCIDAGTTITGGVWDIDGEERVGIIDVGFDEVFDTDDDGLPDIIETGTGVWAGDSNTGSDPFNSDSDGDNVSDGDEWQADTNPNDAGDLLRLTKIWHNTNDEVWVEWVGGTRSHRYLEWTDSATTGTWVGVLHETPPTGLTNAMGTSLKNIEFARIRAHR